MTSAGVWSDALPTLVLEQWRVARESLLNLNTPTAGAAVQAWLVDKQAQVCKAGHVLSSQRLQVLMQCLPTHPSDRPIRRTPLPLPLATASQVHMCPVQDLAATSADDESVRSGAAAAGASAEAAQRMLAVVQRFVALQQLHMVRVADAIRASS